MIFRLANWAVMGVAIFYVAEGTGLLERGKYFPTLPRLEASASNPSAWFGAVQWGISYAAGRASEHGYHIPEASDFTQRQLSYGTSAPVRLGGYAENTAGPAGTLKRLAGYYGG